MKRENIMVASGVNLVAGIWLMVSPFVLGFTGSVMSNVFFVGLLVALFALVRMFTVETTGWLSWLNAVLGVWLLISPLFMAALSVGAIWNSIILGVIVIIAGVSSAMGSTMGHGHPKMG